MAGTSNPDDPKPDDPELPHPLPEFPELDPLPDDGTPADEELSPDDMPFVPPPGTQ